MNEGKERKARWSMNGIEAIGNTPDELEAYAIKVAAERTGVDPGLLSVEDKYSVDPMPTGTGYMNPRGEAAFKLAAGNPYKLYASITVSELSRESL